MDDDSEDFSGVEAADASDDDATLCFIERTRKYLDEISV